MRNGLSTAFIILVLTLVAVALIMWAWTVRAPAQLAGQQALALQTCLLMDKGISEKQAVLRAWNVMLLGHVAKTGDNIVALPGMETEQVKRFENGLRRAIAVDKKVQAIIDRIYDERKP